jgi:hypothetical protein
VAEDQRDIREIPEGAEKLSLREAARRTGRSVGALEQAVSRGTLPVALEKWGSSGRFRNWTTPEWIAEYEAKARPAAKAPAPAPAPAGREESRDTKRWESAPEGRFAWQLRVAPETEDPLLELVKSQGAEIAALRAEILRLRAELARRQ